MKKFFLLLAAFTMPLLAEVPPVENKGAESPSLDFPSSVYALPKAPIQDRLEKQEIPNSKPATIAIIGTIVAVTIGLLISGSNTGKHILPQSERDKSFP